MLGRNEPAGQRRAIHLLFAAVVFVAVGSLLGEWAGILQWLGTAWFWFGNQGWEYLEIGRAWQILLALGLVFWFGLLWRNVAPARRDPAAPRARRVLPDRRGGDPGILPAGAVLRRHHPLHDRRHLAVLDHPSVGRGLLRAVRHRHRRHHLLRARAGGARHGAARHLPRRHPDLRRRADRHRASLVLQRPDRAQHGAVGGLLGARGGSADADHARCLGLRHGDPRRGQRAVPAQMDVLLPDGGGLLELHRRRHLRLPHQHADRQLFRDGHEPDAQSRPCGDDGRVRHAGRRA